jgi:hypothetical protein
MRTTLTTAALFSAVGLIGRPGTSGALVAVARGESTPEAQKAPAGFPR